ncbi:MAG: hypothetical protein JWN86_4313 [Planctomycetota bacterium]|nr:hypothetical protein [Planctomycetota bacterium]
MSATDDLRLAWQAHRDGRPGRRDALLTLAVASAESDGEPWVGRVRDFLVASRPDHLFAGFYHLDEAMSDPRVAASLKRLREAFPPARVRWLVRGSAISRGPYTGRKVRIATLLDDLLAPPRCDRRLASTPVVPKGSLGSTSVETSAPILAFYLEVLLATAMLCALVLNEMPDQKRAA